LGENNDGVLRPPSDETVRKHDESNDEPKRTKRESKKARKKFDFVDATAISPSTKKESKTTTMLLLHRQLQQQSHHPQLYVKIRPRAIMGEIIMHLLLQIHQRKKKMTVSSTN
jgi:hypothetical protein